MDFIIILQASIPALIPLLIAGIGELVCEKSGVLNLGIEGMMLVGCVSGFVVTIISGNLLLGFIAAAFFGLLMASIFAILTVILRANQIASGLALTIFGTGLSAFIGLNYEGTPLSGLDNITIPILSNIPIVGKLLFNYDLMVYFAFILFFAIHYFLYKTRSGLILRAVGENHNAAYSMGYNVIKIRFLAVLFGGAMAGLAGSYLSLVYTALWTENMTAGRGWIALALVVFATWRPMRLLLGAFLFGFISILQLFLQANDGILRNVAAEFFTMLPYIITIIVLVVMSAKKTKKYLGAPLDLAKTFELK